MRVRGGQDLLLFIEHIFLLLSHVHVRTSLVALGWFRNSLSRIMMNVYCFFLKFISIDLSCTYIRIRPSALFFFFTILLPPPVLYNMGSHYRQCFLVLCSRYYIVEAFTAILTRDIAMVMANILSLRVNIYRSLVALYSWKELVQVNFFWCVCRLRRPKRFDLVLMLFQINRPDVYNGRSYGADWFIACFMHNLYYRLASFF